MNYDLARFGAWFQAKISSLTNRQFTIGGVAGSLITLGCFALVTVAPTIRGEKLPVLSWDSWSRAIAIGWPAFAAAFYLKYAEAFKRRRSWNKLQRRLRTTRQILTGKALRDLCVSIRKDPNFSLDPSSVKDLREMILTAAAMGVQDLLGLTSEHTVTANLLEFSHQQPMKMKVAARSAKDRVSNAEYSREDLLGWAAIKQARIQHVDDISQDHRWNSHGKRTYRAVAAIPVGFDGNAFGALTIDCSLPYAFYGRITDIAIQLEPYAVVLALTFSAATNHHEECRYEPNSAA